MTVTAMVPAVVEALRRERLEVEGWERITRFGAALSRRHSYRVRLAGGQTIKARLTLDVERARRVSELLATVASLPWADRFPRVLSRHGAVLLEEWIEGAVLPVPMPATHLRESARLLAALHQVEVAGGRRVVGVDSTAARLAATEEGLARLAGAGLLGRDEVTALLAALRRDDPGWARHGLAHLDYCPENMIVDAGGRLCVIDNEALAVDALDFDLARVWCRSELSEPGWAIFAGEYHRCGGPGAIDGPQHFWRIAAAVSSALVRLVHAPTHVQAPRDRLRLLAAAPRG